MTKFALVIGVSDYGAGLNPLPQAANNAEAIEEVLLNPKWGDFSRTNLLFLKNQDKKTIETAIEKLFFGRQQEDLLLLFFSGRAIEDSKGKLYLAAHNTRKNERGNLIKAEVENAVATNFIRKNMNRCNSQRQIVILDTCFSSVLAREDDGIDIIAELSGDRRIIATASTSTRYCFGKFGEDLSEYSAAIIEGIKSGDGDLDDDGAISLREIHQYASEKLKLSDPIANPQIDIPRDIAEIELFKVYINNPEGRYYQQVQQRISNRQISPSDRASLEAIRNKLKLSPAQAKAIEDRIFQTLQEELQQKLNRYERDYTEALKQELSPTPADLQRIKENLQTILELNEAETRAVTAKVESQIEAYRGHLREYEQILLLAMQKENPLSQITLEQLGQMQVKWQLSDRDVALAESRANLEIKRYREKLLEYEHSFTRAIEQQYPLNKNQLRSLAQIQQSLGLSDRDVKAIKQRLTPIFESYHYRLAQYKKFYDRSLKNSYPLTEAARQELKQAQLFLKLSDADILKVEGAIVTQQNSNNSLIQSQENQLIWQESFPEIKAKIGLFLSQIYQNIANQIPPNLFAQINSKIPKNIERNIFISRRKYLKWILISVLGGIGAILLKETINLIINGNKSGDRENQNNNNARQNTEPNSVENSQQSLPEKQTQNNLKTFQFTVVTLNSKGQQINTTSKSAPYLSAEIGNGIAIETVAIPSGSFTMGTPTTERASSSQERPQHQVNIKAFYLGRYQVTQAQWQQVASLPRIAIDLDPNPSSFQGDRRLPVETITWNEAIEFCQRLSQKTGHKYRLPSEAEWEYAARAGTTTPFHFGPTITSQLANYNGTFIYTAQPKTRFRRRSVPVGSFSANAFGLYDMHGNVWEWCQDTWHNTYSGAPQDGSPWISNNTQSRVIRGGSWHSDARSCRSGYREPHGINNKYETLGLRIVREI